MYNYFNTAFELAESDIDTAVLPLGSVEPKGPHLPAGLDLILANRFSRDFCTGKAVCLLPAFPYSSAMETRGFCGTLSLQQQTLWDVLFDIASTLARLGFKTLIILDFGNFNWIVKQAVRELNLNREIIQSVWVNPKEFAKESANAEYLPDFGGGAVETSLAMFLDEKLVRSPLENYSPEYPREYIDYLGLAKVSPEGYWGNPTKASKALGEKYYDLMMDRTIKFVRYAVDLIEPGAVIENQEIEELWWPNGYIPGVENSGIDWHSSFTEIANHDSDMVIIPTSAIEQHSPSQPLATDYFQALELSRRVAQELNAYLLPALPIFTSWGHIRFKGTITLCAMTARRVLEDVAESLIAGGFRRAAIINIHGGNWVLKPTLIEINQKHPGFELISTGDLLSYRGQQPVEQLHACESEASFIKAFYPETFREDKLIDHSPQCPAAAFDLTGIGSVSPKGVWGYPSRGSAEKGREDLEIKVIEAVAYITKTFSEIETQHTDR